MADFYELPDIIQFVREIVLAQAMFRPFAKIIKLSLSAVIGIAVIGPDFDIDLAFYKMTSGERLRDIIDNSYTRQSIRR